MWTLIFSLFVLILIAGYFLIEYQGGNVRQGIEQTIDMVRTGAFHAVQILSACNAKGPGTYTVPVLMGAQFPSVTPTGNRWVCKVTTGGTNSNGNVVVMFMDGPPKQWGGEGALAAASPDLQLSYAWKAVAVLTQEFGGDLDVSIGVVNPNDPAPMLNLPGGQVVDLTSAMPGNLAYSTPVIAVGNMRTAP